MAGLTRLFLGALTAAALSACATGPIGSSRTFTQSVNDSASSMAVKARMLRQTDYDFTHVDINVVDGLVLLTGAVDAPRARVEAERLAWSAPHVRLVANEITIGEAPERGFLASEDQRISAAVRSRLVASEVVLNATINVETYNGVVYLLGRSRTEFEAKRAAEEASFAPGVVRVVTYLRAEEALDGPRRSEVAGDNGLLGGPGTTAGGVDDAGWSPGDDSGLAGGPS